jgi:hypothetical protein
MDGIKVRRGHVGAALDTIAAVIDSPLFRKK